MDGSNNDYTKYPTLYYLKNFYYDRNYINSKLNS